MDKLTEKAAALLREGAATLVIGYGEDKGNKTRPLFCRIPEEAARLVYDGRCIHNLAVYLTKPELLGAGRTAVVATIPVLRSILQLAAENQLSEDKLLVLTVADGGALVEVLTPKGERLAAEASSLFASADGMSKEEYLARVEKRFDAQQLREKLDQAFDSPVWKRQSERCLGCGACAFVCPTCACFDIQEDARGATGRRVRCWDSCGFSLFTLHTSGHNPRPVQSARWRQRVLHKFSYMPERIGQTGCTGCGRCSRACPVNMNLLEHLQSI